MKVFDVDTEFTRMLARELAQEARGDNPPAPQLGEFGAFGAAVAAAVRNVGERTTRLREDLDQVSRASAAMVGAAETQDAAAAREFGGAL